MKTSCCLVPLLVGVFFSSYYAFPPTDHTLRALSQTQIMGSSQHSLREKAPAAEQQVNTVRVTCHPDSLEIIIDADLFDVGVPVNGDELRLGVEHDDYCRATMSSRDEFRILVGLVDCGTNQRVILFIYLSILFSHYTSFKCFYSPQMTEDTLVYTNLLVYSPVASPVGLVRMEEAVIPIECRYERFVFNL